MKNLPHLSSHPTPHSTAPINGAELYQLIESLYPICRSITGDGVRQSLEILKQYIPLSVFEVPTGTEVFDWKVPKEWNIREAWIKNAAGEKVVDFQNHNLHLLNYSVPVHRKLSLEELKPHLHTLPEQPDWIPYRTSYYQENWGFCLTHRQLEQLEAGEYEVYIDASLEDGHLTYGELFIPGESKDEVLFSAHICHPSLANDNLAGISVLTHLAQTLLANKNHYSYRFLFIPGTIGAITWLALNQSKTTAIRHGLVASLLGDAGAFTYKKSRIGNADIDRMVEYALEESSLPFEIIDFFPYGYDERQFCSPGFNLAVGNLTRSQFGQYPEYHTSADDLTLVQPQYLEESFKLYRRVVTLLEQNRTYQNLNPFCEPQLGKRGLYDAIGGNSDAKALQMAMLWVLNQSDGTQDLLAIAIRSGIAFSLIAKASQLLLEADLLALA